MGAYIPRAHPHLQERLNTTAPSKGPPCSRVPYFSGSLGNTAPSLDPPLPPPWFFIQLEASIQFWRKYFWAFYLPGWVAEDRCKRSQYNSTQKASAQRTVYQVTRFHSSWKSWQFRHTQLQVSHQLG